MNHEKTLKFNKKITLTIVFITCFIIIYLSFLNSSVIFTSRHNPPIIQLIGFALLIIGFFYFFLNLSQSKINENIFNFNSPNENTIITILIVLMCGTYFITPITFSEMIIAWEQVPVLNYVRGIIFLVGCAFVPGSCIFALIFPKSTLHEKFNVEPFFVKIIIFPIISFAFLGTITLIFDKLEFVREMFAFALFLTILALYILNIFIQMHRNQGFAAFKTIKISVSKHTTFMLFAALCVIIIALGIISHTKYLSELDGYRAISYSTFIGLEEADSISMFYTSTIYWSYISFGLSALSGLPAININAMLFPFLYLFVLSLYLLMKSILNSKKEIYAILSTLLAITFSSLFYIFQNDYQHDRISLFVFDGLFTFRYKSFALILFIISLSLFIIIFKNSYFKSAINFIKNEDFRIILISAFFLLQSFMIYFLPVIPAMSLIILLIMFSNKKKQVFKYYFSFILLLALFFVVIDLITNNFFSWITITQLSYFLGLPLYINDPIFSNKLLLNSFFAYSIVIGFLLFNYLLYQIYKKFLAKIKKRVLNVKFNAKLLFKTIIGVFSTLLILEILLNLIRTIRSLEFFTLLLHLLFYNIGFIGILGIFSAYYLFKMDKRIFYVLSVWLLFFFGLATIGMFINWIKYPNLTPTQLPGNMYFRLVHYWFNRIWYYSIIPLSLFTSVGILKIIKVFSAKNYFSWRNGSTGRFLTLSAISIVIFFSLSNTIIAGIQFNNEGNTILTDEEAQITGWIANNVNYKTNVLVDRMPLLKFLDDITKVKVYPIDEEVKTAISSDYRYGVSYKTDTNCSIDYIEKVGNYDNVIDILDNNSMGSVSIDISLFSEIRSASIEFFIKATNTSKGFWLNSSLSSVLNGFSLGIASDSFFYFNGSSYEKIVDIENDKWYQIRIDFECTNNNYSGLDKNQWKITINGTEYGNYDFWNDISFVNYMEVFTSQLDSGWNVYITGLNFSWDSDFKFEHYLFNYLKVIDYLKTKNIPYLILSKEPTSFNVEAEKYIDIYGELIPFFYKNKLYEFGNLAVYYANYL